MKKITSIILSVVLILNIFCTLDITVSAETSGDYEYIISSDSATITKYKGSSTNVTIPNSIGGYNVTGIGNGAFFDCTSLNSVTIPDSVTSIGASAFRYCENLTSITIGNSVTNIESLSFNDCKSLTSINVESNNKNYTSVNGNLYNKNKTELIQYAVGKTDETFLIPDSVTSIGNWAFSGCTNLMNVNIPDSVTSIGNSAFSGCTNLMNVNIPDSVTSIGSSAFYNTAYYSNKSNWKNDVLYIGKFLISANASIADIYRIKDGTTLIASGAFSSCENIRSITIPDSVTSIGDYAFYNCKYLSIITIPASVTSIGERAFYNCISLTNITIPASVTSIGERVFGQCKSLSNIEVDINNLNYSSIDGNLYNKETTKLIHCAFAKYDFYRLTFPNGVTSIGSYAFDGCSGLTDISIPDSVTSIDDCAFYRCASLKSITIPDSVTSIGHGTFGECKKLESITIPNSVTSIGDDAFYACYSLTNITIPNSVTSIGRSAFSSCSSLKRVLISNSVKSIGDSAFYRCSSLTSITIPDSVTSIGDGAFYECTKLYGAIVPIDLIDLNTNNIFPSTTKIYYIEKEFSINYDANGGIGAPEQLHFTSDTKTISFTVTKQIPSRTGYIFEGWSKEPNGSADYLPGKKYTISKSITLYAVWKERHTYTIKYELSGGEGDIPSQIKTEGIDLKLSSIIPTHAKYTFAYWISSDKQTTYSAGSSYKADANLTLYAVWKEKCPKCDGSQFSSITKCNTCKGKGTVTTSYTCTNCKGTGKKTKTSYETCSNCHGSGTYYGYGLSTNGMGWQFLPCPYCNAKGTIKKVEQVTCTTCGGDGIESSTSWCPECHHAGQIKTKCDECEGKGYFYHYPDYSIEDNPDSELTGMILGDVDCDGVVSIIDATCIQRHLAEIPVYSYNEAAADTDGDGSVTILDATCIQRYLAELPCFAGIGNPIS